MSEKGKPYQQALKEDKRRKEKFRRKRARGHGIAMDVHALARAKQRLGIDLSHEEKMRVIDEITSGRAILVKRNSNTRSVYQVRICGIDACVAYDWIRGKIVTVMEKQDGKDQ